jgi:hypothetical protein
LKIAISNFADSISMEEKDFTNLDLSHFYEHLEKGKYNKKE